ncbi:MAG TPA: Rrf2 family transcriptional regulator [Candidatus Limnocylindrales bacterium]|nr:Rrf2 family transcriptional regulator [Candidatus Limnocylindrales bacterium]
MRLELTKRADYGIRVTLALAGADRDRVLSARSLALSQRIPARFVNQVMADLVAAGIAEGRIGRAGGYRLTAAGRSKTLLDVIEAIEGDSRRRVCVLRGDACRPDGPCGVHAVFAAAQDELLSHLAGATIAALAWRPDTGAPLAEGAMGS